MHDRVKKYRLHLAINKFIEPQGEITPLNIRREMNLMIAFVQIQCGQVFRFSRLIKSSILARGNPSFLFLLRRIIVNIRHPFSSFLINWIANPLASVYFFLFKLWIASSMTNRSCSVAHQFRNNNLNLIKLMTDRLINVACTSIHRMLNPFGL